MYKNDWVIKYYSNVIYKIHCINYKANQNSDFDNVFVSNKEVSCTKRHIKKHLNSRT